jgi:RimJ/RimL family protein N-acetyltransferase
MDSGESQAQLRDPSCFIGRVGVKECAEYGAPFPDNLTIPKEVLEQENILKLEVGYAFLSKAWGKGYATEAMKAFIEAYLERHGFWDPPFERVYLHGVSGCANLGSRRVMEKVGFKLNGIHRWNGPDVFIGGAMQPPEVAVYSLGPSVGHNEPQGSENSQEVRDLKSLDES